jgi:hypothetical protein
MFQIPLALPAGTRAVWFKSNLQFFIGKGEGARILLMGDLAGYKFVKEFPYAETVSFDNADNGVWTFEFVHQAQTLPTENYTFTMSILIERLAADKFARVYLDVLDIWVNPDLSVLATPNPETDSPPSSPPA